MGVLVLVVRRFWIFGMVVVMLFMNEGELVRFVFEVIGVICGLVIRCWK